MGLFPVKWSFSRVMIFEFPRRVFSRAKKSFPGGCMLCGGRCFCREGQTLSWFEIMVKKALIGFNTFQ